MLSCEYKRKPKALPEVKNKEISLNEAEREDSVRITEYFLNKFKKGRFSGVFLFAEKGKVITKGAFGYSDLKKKDSLGIDSPFQLASVSKTITATAVMQLVQNHQISLEDSIQCFLPRFPYHDITIRYLLSHQSGLPEYWYFTDSLWNDWSNPITNDDVMCLFEKNCPPRYYIPGKKYNYINSNFVVLAKIVQVVSGLSFEDYVRENIFDRAEMYNSFVYSEFDHPEYKFLGVKGHERNRRYSEISYLNGVVGDKGTYSTVEDMYKLDRALRNNVLLSDTIQELMYSPQHKKLYDWDNYGLGWRVNFSDSTNKIVYHNGWWKGFKTSYIRELDNDRVIVILSNYLRYGHFNVGEMRRLFDGD